MFRWIAAGAAAGMIALSCTSAWAGAWLMKPGEYYVKLFASYLYTEEEYDKDGNLIPTRSGVQGITNGSYEEIAVTAYVEYGLSERVTLVGSVPYKMLTSSWTELGGNFQVQRDIEATNRGMTDLRAGVRYPLKTSGFPISVEGIIKLPLGYDPSPDLEQVPPLGSGKVDAGLRLLAGVSLWPFPGYLNGVGGYRFRGGLADEVFFNVETGVTWWRIFGKVSVDGIFSTEEPEDLGTSPTLTVNNEDVLKLIAELNYSITGRLALTAEAFHVLAGRNTVAGTTWAAGFIFRN